MLNLVNECMLFNPFLAILCNSITNENGGSGPNEQSFDSAKQFTWTRQELSKVEMQGFMNLAKKVGSKFCMLISSFV